MKKWSGDTQKEKTRHNIWKESVAHVEFCIELYRHHLNKGGRFLHENPLGASSWAIASMHALLQVKADMCRFGMTQENSEGKQTLVRKPTRFATNSWAIEDELDNICEGGHEHCRLLAGQAEATQVYPDKLCKAICRGLKQDMDMESAAMSTTRKIYRKELSGVAKRAGMTH